YIPARLTAPVVVTAQALIRSSVAETGCCRVIPAPYAGCGAFSVLLPGRVKTRSHLAAVIIHRAFYREATQATVGIALVLVAVCLPVGVTSALGRTVRGDYAQSIVARLIAWQTVRHVDLMLPLGFYLGVLLTLGRWYRDSEMTVLAACGVGLPQLLRPVLLLAAGVAALVAVLAFQLTPHATRAIQERRAEGSERPELAGITPGTFSASAADGRILYAEQV